MDDRGTIARPDAVRDLDAEADRDAPSIACVREQALVPWRADVELAETHVSTLVFTDGLVHKRKRAVTFPFVDLATPGRREQMCHREVELNRRFSPDVYLGVEDIVDDTGEVVDHAVLMRRMPASRRLSSLVEDGVDVRGCLRAVARIMAVAHARPPVGADLSDVATPGALHELWDASLGQLATFSPVPIERERLDTIRWLAHRFLAGRTPLLAERLDRGLVVDGHGDLMADDIFCLPDGPRILDCLEFDDRLRWGDVVNDVGFLAMDLDRLGRPGLARFFLDQYREFSAETHPVSLEHHYVAYRALVRAKVACLRGGAAAEIEAREHVARCERHLREGRIRLVLIGGLPGTGKSTVAAHLGRRLGWTVLRSDEIRKQRAGLDALDPVTVSFGADVYSSSVTTSTYTEMLADAGRLLDHGESVILDASFSQQRWRAAARDMAARSATDVVELRCVLPADIAAARLVERRRRRVDASDATAAIAATMADRFDPWPGSLEVETTAAPGDLTAALLAHLDAVPANVGSGSG